MIATATQTVKFFIAGDWQEQPESTLHPITNPATGETIAYVPYATAVDVDRAARAAP